MSTNSKQRIIATYTINYDVSKTASISLVVDADDNKGLTDFIAGQDINLRLYSDKEFIFDMIGQMVPGSSEGQFKPVGSVTNELAENINEELLEFVGEVSATVSKVIVSSFVGKWLGGNVPCTVANTAKTNIVVVTPPTGAKVADLVGIAQVTYLSKYQKYLFSGGSSTAIADMVWVIMPIEALYPTS